MSVSRSLLVLPSCTVLVPASLLGCKFPACCCVASAYWSLPNELDCRPAVLASAAAGAGCCASSKCPCSASKAVSAASVPSSFSCGLCAIAANGEVMPGLLPALLAASCIEATLFTAGSVGISLRGRCCLRAAVSSETPKPRDGFVNRLSASSNLDVTGAAPLALQ